MHFSKFEFFLPTLHRICQGRLSFPNIVPHSPIHVSLANLPLILQFYFICQFASNFPICLSFPNLPLIHQFASQFAKRSYLPIISHSFSKPSPTFTKRGRKNIFNTPKYLPWMRKGICRALYCPYPVPVFLKSSSHPEFLYDWGWFRLT